MVNKMREANIEPGAVASIARLYRRRSYRVKAERKMKKLLRF